MAPLTELKCQHCLRPFSRLSRVVRTKIKQGIPLRFCSHPCALAFINNRPETRVTASCESCEKEIVRPRSHVGKRIYCSKRCADSGKKMENPPYRNPVIRREYEQRYRAANKDRLKENRKRWLLKNKGHGAFVQQKRRAAGAITFAEWKRIIEDAGCCAHCRAVDRLEVDHILAISQGGKTERDNLQVLCRSCNASKGAGLVVKRPRSSNQLGES